MRNRRTLTLLCLVFILSSCTGSSTVQDTAETGSQSTDLDINALQSETVEQKQLRADLKEEVNLKLESFFTALQEQEKKAAEAERITLEEKQQAEQKKAAEEKAEAAKQEQQTLETEKQTYEHKTEPEKKTEPEPEKLKEEQNQTEKETTASEPKNPGGQQAQVEQIADASPFLWRNYGTKIVVGCAPASESGVHNCPWGLYNFTSNTIYLNEHAFATHQRLKYVVLHELAHAWQNSTGDLNARAYKDLEPWGYEHVDALERAADCLSKAWGATEHYKWDCPKDVEQHMQNIFKNSKTYVK